MSNLFACNRGKHIKHLLTTLEHSYLNEKIIISLKQHYIHSNSFKYASLFMVRSFDISTKSSKISLGFKYTS